MSKRRVGKKHRQQRETNTREKRDLAQENRQLRREVTRLRKQVEKSEEPPDPEEIKEEKAAVKCPQCKGTQLASITTPSGKTIYHCRGCVWRGSI